MFIDTHCHISYKDYEDIDLLIKENVAAGVDKIIVSGCESDNIEEVVDLSLKYKEIYLTLGYHPEYADIIDDVDIRELERLLISNSKVVGVGEIGLDYHYSKENKDMQIELFKCQLDLAKKLNLPVVIHSRDATLDTINILKEYDVFGVIHCFSGSLEVAKTYISMGYKLGIGGVITFKNSKLGYVVSDLELDDIVLETDSPYLAPTPYRGTVNSSKYIPIIASKVAEVFDVDVDTVADITTKNALDVFGL